MTNRNFLIGLLFLVACSDSSKTSISTTGLPTGAVLTDYAGLDLQKAVVKSGIVVIEEGDVQNGERHGAWTAYYPDGKIRTVTSYLDGAKQGPEIQFDNSGYVTTRSPYVAGQLDGEFKAYNRGKLTELKNYSSGELNGLVQKYYANGTIMEESRYVNGTIDGEARWYDQEGNLSIKYTYDMGELIDDGSSKTED